MHVGVVRSTDSRKSFPTRHVIIPLMNEAGYSALVFDWHGCDYAPFVGEDRKIAISDVELDGAAVARYLAEKASYFATGTSKTRPAAASRTRLKAPTSGAA